MRVRQQRAEDDLRDLMPARGKLIEHQMLAWYRGLVAIRRLLDVIQGARDEHRVHDTTPIEWAVGDARPGTSRSAG